MSSSSQSAPSGSTPAATSKPARNPIERLVVWGLIVALVVVTALEARARLAYSQSMSRIQDALAAAEGTEISTFTIDQLPALLTGSFTEDHVARRFDRQIHYQWKGLFKQYGLHVSYGTHTKVVTGIVSDDAPPEEPRPALAAEEGGSRGDGGEGDGGSGEGASEEGRRPRFDPMQADADSDGRLSKAEAPGRIGENFGAIDANQDGFLDSTELANRPRPQFGGNRGGERPGRDAEGEQRRPETDESPAAAGEASPSDVPAPAAEPAPAADGAAPSAGEATPPTADK